MPTYGTAAKVVARAGNRPVTASSSPSLTDVEDWLDEAEAELIGAIVAGGGPSSYGLGPPLSRGALQIRSWVENYVAGVLRMSHAGAGGDGANDDGQHLFDWWQELLDKLRENTSSILAQLDSQGATPSAAIRMGSHVHDTALGLSDDAVAPLFTIEKGRSGGNF